MEVIVGLNMFGMTVADARVWKNLLTAISTLIEETDVEANPEGIKLRSMDPSHVAMVDFELPKTAFEEFNCPAPKKIRLNISQMLKLLKRVRPDESLQIKYDDDTKKLELTLKGKIRRRFTIPTLEPSGEDVPTPKVTFNSRVRLTTESLRDIIEDAQAISDSVRFEANEDKMLVKASGEMSSADIEMEKGSETILDLQIKEPSKATYNLNYLAEIIKAGTTASEVATLEFSTNMPIKIEFEMPQQGKLLYYLAPRIEAE